MPVKFTCPACGYRLQASDEAVGRQGRCLSCGAKVRVPSTEASASMTHQVDGAERSSQGVAERHVAQQTSGDLSAPIQPTRVPFGAYFSQAFRFLSQNYSSILLLNLVVIMFSSLGGGLCGIMIVFATRLFQSALLQTLSLALGIFLEICLVSYFSLYTIHNLVVLTKGKSLDMAAGEGFSQAWHRMIRGIGVLFLIGVVIGPVYACAGIFFPAFQAASHQVANSPGEMNSLSPFTALGMQITTALGVNAFMCVFGFALYALADQNTGILDSFAISARITAGNRIRCFFAMILAAIPVVVLGLLLVLLGESLQASESEAASLYLLLIGLVF